MTAWWVQLLAAVLRVLIPAILKRARPTAEDARSQPLLRERLRDRIRRHWGAALVVVVALSLGGCGVRTIYVPHGTPVRLRETIRDAKVWVKDSGGEPVAGVMNLPEGWYALPLSDTD